MSVTSTLKHPEPAGWGAAGTIRHAEEIGHTVWLSEHPEERTDDVYPDYDPVVSGRLDDHLDDVFGKPQCGVRHCVLPPHDARWMQHIDKDGRGWYAGEAPR